jgi:hypothetical protein
LNYKMTDASAPIAPAKPKKEALFFYDSEPESDDDQKIKTSSSSRKEENLDETEDERAPTTSHKDLEVREVDVDGDFEMIDPPPSSSKRDGQPSSVSTTRANSPRKPPMNNQDIRQPEAGPSRPTTPPGDSTLDGLTFRDLYIGEYFCSGWSLNKGKGYCSNGSRIHIERNKSQEERDREREAKAKSKGKEVGQVSVTGPTVIKNGKVMKPGGKQMTLGAMGIGKKTVRSDSKLFGVECHDQLFPVLLHRRPRSR